MIVLLQPPFFRTVGSHNDRPPLELAYASRYLHDAGIEHVVVNADYLGSTVHVPWRRLFENEIMLRDAVDGFSPLLDECVELVMQFKPSAVVIAAGDSCIPTKDFGSPYIAARVSQRLKDHGVRTIGIGPMFIKDSKPFESYFHEFFPSLVNRSLVDVVEGDRPDVMVGTPIGTTPLFDYMYPAKIETDYVMSSFGCSFDCSFCLAPVVSARRVSFQPVGVFIRELLERSRKFKSLYIADMIFPLNIRRLRLLAESLEGAGLDLACESRVDTLSPETLTCMKKMGITTVKVGLESMDDDTLVSMSKRQNLKTEERALFLLREYGMKIVGYMILGDFYTSTKAMEMTLEKARSMDVDHWVVNISSYQTFGWDDRRYDAHFSMAAARRQGVPPGIVWSALELQENTENPTLDLIKKGETCR